VLNASEQGLAFHAAAAVRHPGPIRLCVSPNPEQRIEVIAEIVWMDETKSLAAYGSRNLLRTPEIQLVDGLRKPTSRKLQVESLRCHPAH